MDKKIFTVGYEIPGKSELELPFSSKRSLMDADILVFSPVMPNYDLFGDSGTYMGKLCYSEHGSSRLQEDFKHWEKEINNFLKYQGQVRNIKQSLFSPHLSNLPKLFFNKNSA